MEAVAGMCARAIGRARVVAPMSSPRRMLVSVAALQSQAEVVASADTEEEVALADKEDMVDSAAAAAAAATCVRAIGLAQGATPTFSRRRMRASSAAPRSQTEVVATGTAAITVEQEAASGCQC